MAGNKIFRGYMKTVPKFLYKYYRSVCNLELSLCDKYIHFELPSEYNDVFDSAISAHDEDLSHLMCTDSAINIIIQYTDREYKERVANIDFSNTQNFTDMLGLVKKELGEAVSNKIKNRVLKNFTNIQASNNKDACFSERPDHILMWCHYGDALKGGCLCFDTTKDIELFSNAQKIQYTDTRVHRDGFNQYFVKSSVWAYEQEWRIVVDQQSDRIYTDSIYGLILGEKMCLGDFFRLSLKASEMGIPVYKASADREIYKINIAKWGGSV